MNADKQKRVKQYVHRFENMASKDFFVVIVTCSIMGLVLLNTPGVKSTIFATTKPW